MANEDTRSEVAAHQWLILPTVEAMRGFSDWLAQHDREVGAKALREAVEALNDHEGCCCEPEHHVSFVAGPDWLLARADRMAGESR